jgi:proline iminopeptidase
MAKFCPVRKPYKKGYLQVSDGYKIYYHLYGNPKGKPVLFLHGGPGAGTEPKDARFFNPRIYNAILFDQRGAGKSKPFASIKNNTTWKLIEDINILLRHLGIKRVFLFGGSWGSTLALVYAIKYPNRVTGMLLRGVFLCDKEDSDYYLKGGTATHFPDVWERFLNNVPRKHRKDPLSYYLNRMQSKNKKIADKFAKEYTRYEVSILKLKITEKEIRKILKKNNLYKSMGMIESYYLKNMCFLPQKFILKNAKKISKIPTVIVHGRYDVICRPLIAYRLHKALPRSKLYFVTAGHGRDEEMVLKLKEEMDKFSKIL